MKKEREESTEQRIIEAARKVFTQRGFDGARMQEIADEAGINKALLHYYFRSKEKLFEVIFADLLGKFQVAFQAIFASDKSFTEKIRLMVETDIDILMRYPDMPLFVISEIARNPQKIAGRVSGAGLSGMVEEFARQVRSAARRGEIRKADPLELLINILALNRFPFVGKPMIRAIAELSEESFLAMMKRRKKQVADLVIGDLKRGLPTGE